MLQEARQHSTCSAAAPAQPRALAPAAPAIRTLAAAAALDCHSSSSSKPVALMGPAAASRGYPQYPASVAAAAAAGLQSSAAVRRREQ